MIVQGKVHSVETYPSGTQVVAGYAAGATVLEVGSYLDLQETGGTVTILGALYSYTLNTDASTITLGSGLLAAIEDGEEVLAYPPSLEKRVYAYVDDGEDAVIAVVPHALQGDLDEGIREETGRETVVLEEVRGTWMVQNIVALDALSDVRTRQAMIDAAAAVVAANAASGVAADAMTAANGKNTITHTDYAPTTEANVVGDTWYVHDTGTGAIIGQYQGLGGTSWAPTTISHQVISSVDLGTATVGKLAANYIESGVLSAALTLTGYLLAGNPTGARVVVDDEGIRQYDADGNVVINLPTDPDVPSVFEGAVIANSLTIKDYMSLQGLANEIARGAVLTVSSGTGAPLTAPSIAVAYQEYANSRFGAGGVYIPRGNIGDIDDSPEILAAGTFFGYGKIYGKSGKYWTGPSYTDSAGGIRTKYGNIGAMTAVAVGGVERIVINSVLCTGNGATPTGAITSLDPSVMTNSGTVEPTRRAQMGVKLDDYIFYFRLGRVFGGLSGTQYPERIAVLYMNYNVATPGVEVGKISLRQYTVTDSGIFPGGFTAVAGSDLVVTSPLAANEGVIGVTHGRSDKLKMTTAGTDFVWLIHGSVKTYAYTTAGVRVPDYDFPTPAGASQMSAYGNIVSNGFIGFRTTEWAEDTPITKLTNNHWTGTVSSKWWVSTTNYDNDITGGTHESKQGPRASITMPKRAGLAVTVPPYPVRPSPTTTDDPLAARIYLGRAATDAGRTMMERAGELSSPARTLAIGDFTFPALPANTASVPPPLASNFPASAPGKIVSADGTSWALQGDGIATFAGVTFDGAVPGFASSAMRTQYWRYSTAGVLNVATTTEISTGTNGGSGSFIAPPSGSVKISWGALMASRLDGQWIATMCLLRTGSTVGAGTLLNAWNANDAILVYDGARYTAGHREHVFTGLTPGSAYNLQQVVRTSDTTAGAEFYRGYIVVDMIP